MNMKKAFTLAEVLITLGIIGVVSAMTIPTLMQDHQRKTYVVQIQTAYNLLQRALDQVIIDKQASNLYEAGLTSTTNITTFLKEYFRVVNTCSSASTPCFADSYENLSHNAATSTTISGGSRVTLNNGISIAMNLSGSGTSATYKVVIDVNGQKMPNIVCRDVYYMTFKNSGDIDTSSDSCFLYLMENGWEMDSTYDSTNNSVTAF